MNLYERYLKKVIGMGIALSVSVSISFTSLAAYDSKSGLANNEKNQYVNSEGQVVLSSEQWLHAQPFFEGYAIILIGNEYSSEINRNIFTFSIIDESGAEIYDFWLGINSMYSSINFNRFVENPYGYIWWICSGNTSGLIFMTGKSDGTINTYELPQYCSEEPSSLYTYYTIGTFRDGSANIYKMTDDFTDWWNGTRTSKAVGSITIDGQSSAYINPKSEYKEERERIPAYGTKQFRDPVITSGWKENSDGWWYENADGTYPINAWKEINSKWYYFGEDGYMFANTTTPDGFLVGLDGAWIQ